MIGDPSTTTTYTITWRKLGEDATRTSRVAITEGYTTLRDVPAILAIAYLSSRDDSSLVVLQTIDGQPASEVFPG